MYKDYLFVVGLALASVAYANPVEIRKCNAGDTKCIKQSTVALLPHFAKGLPEYGVESLDPYTFKKLDASSPSLKLVFRDLTAKGLKDCKVKKVERDVAKSNLFVKLICDVKVDGDYEMKGQLLVLPIEGKGKVHINLKQIQISAELEMGEIDGGDGKRHWDIKSWKHFYDLKEKSDLVFENLFPTNEILGRAARELVSSSSNDIINEVGQPVIKTMAATIIKTVNEFFHKVPAEDLSLD